MEKWYIGVSYKYWMVEATFFYLGENTSKGIVKSPERGTYYAEICISLFKEQALRAIGIII